MASRILFISQDSLNISNKVEITAKRCCSPNHYKQFEINIMNWYIYWYFAIKYFFWGLLGYGRAGNYIGFVFFYLPFVALIMALIAPFPFVNDNKLLIYLSCSILFIVINEIVFWDETKRYRRWNNHYRNNGNNRKSWFFVAISIIGTVSWFFLPLLLKDYYTNR